jgi:hypothetical protein
MLQDDDTIGNWLDDAWLDVLDPDRGRWSCRPTTNSAPIGLGGIRDSRVYADGSGVRFRERVAATGQHGQGDCKPSHVTFSPSLVAVAAFESHSHRGKHRTSVVPGAYRCGRPAGRRQRPADRGKALDLAPPSPHPTACPRSPSAPRREPLLNLAEEAGPALAARWRSAWSSARDVGVASTRQRAGSDRRQVCETTRSRHGIALAVGPAVRRTWDSLTSEAMIATASVPVAVVASGGGQAVPDRRLKSANDEV